MPLHAAIAPGVPAARPTFVARLLRWLAMSGDAPARPALSADDAQACIRAIAGRGDRSAFAALFAAYAPRVKALAMRMGASAEAAEEIAQETLLTVWRKAALFDPERAGVAAWIFAIGRNLRLDRMRRERRAALPAVYEALDADDPARPDDALASAETERRVRGALGALTREQARVVVLSFFEERSHGDIARLLGIPLGTVKSRLRLAMERLRAELGDLS